MNYFVAHNYAHEVNGFVDFKLDPADITAFENADLDYVHSNSPETIYKKKLAWLRDTYPKLRLHYSAGIDSHTILELAQEMGIDFDDVVLETCSMWGDPKLDAELIPGIQYAEKNNVKNFRVIRPEIKHFEKYLDPLWIEDVCGSQLFGFRGAKFDVALRDNVRMTDITGSDKPWMYVSPEGKYYWIISDSPHCQQMRWDHVLFYLDSFIPEAALKQAYMAKQFLKERCPKFVGLWQAEHNIKDLNDLAHFNQLIGRRPALSKLLSNPKQHGKKHPLYLQYKNSGPMEELRSIGKGELVDAFFVSVERAKTIYKDYNFCINIDNEGHPTGILRWAAVFELGDNYVKHVDDNVLQLG
jgi:hypothetical protein